MIVLDRAVAPVPVADIMRQVPQVRVIGDPATQVSSVVADSRNVVPGALFVALPGEQRDGRHFVGEAVLRGAMAIAAQEPVDVDVVQIIAHDPRAALAPLAAAVYRHPSRHLRVAAITGTDGKTTTGHLADHILRKVGRRTGHMGSLGACLDGVEIITDHPLTTPQADDVQWLMSVMVRNGVQDVIVEASSAGLASRRLDEVDIAAAVITNITEEHLEYHGSPEAYVAAKALLVDSVMGAGGPVVASADDPGCRALRARFGEGHWITFGIDTAHADVHARDLDLARGSSSFTVSTPMGSRRVHLPLPGLFNISNALAAMALALVAGVGLDDVVRALAGAPAVRGRMVDIDEGQPFTVYVDYAHTIAGVGAALGHLRAHNTAGRLIAVLGSGRHPDQWKRARLVEALLAGCDLAVLTVSDAQWESAQDVVAGLASAARSLGAVEGRDFLAVSDRRAAIEQALRAARPGDTVAVLGKGHEAHITLGDQSRPWSDEKQVRDALRVLLQGHQ